MNWNLVGSIYGRFSLKSAHFVMIHYQTWPPQAIHVSDWSISKKSSPLKLLSQMNRNLVGSIYIYRTSEGSILSFLKAEWKVSDTGSAHWASSYLQNTVITKTFVFNFIVKINYISIRISLKESQFTGVGVVSQLHIGITTNRHVHITGTFIKTSTKLEILI